MPQRVARLSVQRGWPCRLHHSPSVLNGAPDIGFGERPAKLAAVRKSNHGDAVTQLLNELKRAVRVQMRHAHKLISLYGVEESPGLITKVAAGRPEKYELNGTMACFATHLFQLRSSLSVMIR